METARPSRVRTVVLVAASVVQLIYIAAALWTTPNWWLPLWARLLWIVAALAQLVLAVVAYIGAGVGEPD